MPLKVWPRHSAAAAYRADIDGLRAIAVTSVVLFHAQMPGFSGGFVGVDVFFVISGYLITRILSEELEGNQFSFLKFYERRIRRIFPALFTVVLFCTAAGIALFPPQQLQEFGRSLLAMTMFSSNVYFTKTSSAQGYFAETQGVRLLLHTWSLSVEEQFYLGFPVLLLVLTRFARRFRVGILLLISIVSFTLSVRGVVLAPIATFYLVGGRAWELLVGCLLALKVLPALPGVAARTAIGVAGLAAVVYAVFSFSDRMLFPGAAALYPCLGTAALIYSGEMRVREGGVTFVTRLLGLPPLVFVGLISYSLYLWHWPLIALFKYLNPLIVLPAGSFWMPVAASFLFAFLTFEFVEKPFRSRQRKNDNRRPRRAIWAGLAVSVVAAAIAIAVIRTQGLPQRFSKSKSEKLRLNYERKAEVASMGSCMNFRTENNRFEDVDFCELGRAKKRVLFWGDSHVVQLYPLLQRMQTQGEFGDKGLVFAIASGCPPSERMNNTLEGYHCDRFTGFALERAAMDDVDTVVLIFSPWWAFSDGSTCMVENGKCGRRLSRIEAWKTFQDETEGHIRELQSKGKRVVIGIPFPLYTSLIPDMEIRNIALAPFGVKPMLSYQAIPLSEIADIRALAYRTGAGLYDPRKALCPTPNDCTYAVDNVSIYSDQSHLATSQLERLHAGLLAAVSMPAGAYVRDPREDR